MVVAKIIKNVDVTLDFLTNVQGQAYCVVGIQILNLDMSHLWVTSKKIIYFRQSTVEALS